MLIPVLMAGGVGSRLWPVSRSQLPKQFIKFPMLKQSLFQDTVSRLRGIEGLKDPMVICNEDHRFLVAEQLREIQHSNAGILLEPAGRNTAPAIALAAFHAINTGSDPTLLVLPADHLIRDHDALRLAIATAEKITNQGYLLTFGIVPDAPETGFGYIEKGESSDNDTAYSVSRFVEKPVFEKAREYLACGNFLWNSGMFMFKASLYLSQLKEFAPSIYDVCERSYLASDQGKDFVSLPHDIFASCPSDSIDYAVMEKTKLAKVIPLDADWNDLGSWDAIWENSEKDESGNAVSGDVFMSGVKNTYIESQTKMVAAIGIENAVIVETADSVLVANKNDLQDVKEIVTQLNLAGRSETQSHSLVRRPWGTYESLATGEGYQVKHIVVNPGASLSLQLHHKRAEHWMVLKGVATVLVGENSFLLQKNEATFIPLGEKHRLTNETAESVEIIEVQMGSYLGEDDIERFDDIYGRAPNSKIT